MNLYVVLKVGIYIRCVCGVFDSLDRAKMAANVLKTSESDDYHGFNIQTVDLNKTLDEPEWSWDRGYEYIVGKVGGK